MCFFPISAERLALILLGGAYALLALVPTTHAQPDPPLDAFIEEQVVQQDVLLEENAEGYLRARDPGRLQLVRTALFAQHGYVFERDSTIQSYFENQDWYEVDETKASLYEVPLSETALSATERKNVRFVQSIEDEARSRLQTFYEKFPPCSFPVEGGLTERTDSGYVPPRSVSFFTEDKIARLPGSGEDIDSFEVEVLMDENPYPKHRASCTIESTDQSRLLLYVSESSSSGGFSQYNLIRFDPLGRRRCTQSVLMIQGSAEANACGSMTITNNQEIWIHSKETSWGRTPEEKTTEWRWFATGPRGALQKIVNGSERRPVCKSNEPSK